MQLTLLGILALGGAILLIYFALNRQPAVTERANRRRSDDGKVIYLFNDKDGEAEERSETEEGAPDAPEDAFTDVEFSETEAEEPDDDGDK
jgi:hypothetical protein